MYNYANCIRIFFNNTILIIIIRDTRVIDNKTNTTSIPILDSRS